MLLKKALLKFWKDYFNFTRGERNAIIILTILTLIFTVYPFLRIDAFKEEKTDFSRLLALAEKAGTDSLESTEYETNRSFQEHPEKRSSFMAAKFRFNPNTATVKDFEKLGFRTFMAKRIEKYRASGGKFRVKADLNKVFGIDQDLVNSLWNEIDLPESSDNPEFRKESAEPEKAKVVQLVEINTADTSQLIGLPGIGSKLAKRIVEFRTKLGGFYSLEQLNEVYGLKPETISIILPKLRLDETTIKLIDINTADFKTLEQHPYLDRNQAAAIVEYRKHHGNYGGIPDLSKVLVLDETALNKIKNYIKF